MPECTECGQPHTFVAIPVCANCFFKPPACSRCMGPNDRIGQRYCHSCHAEWMRENRPLHSELSEEARMKANARAHSHTLLKRGKIKWEPCEVCGSADSEMHHPDYSMPSIVTWLCRRHHLDHHQSVGPTNPPATEIPTAETASQDALRTDSE